MQQQLHYEQQQQKRTLQRLLKQGDQRQPGGQQGN
jgi:hypothetical protein